MEAVIDLHNCDTSTFTRRSLRKYFKQLCDLIDMKRDTLVFWDDSDVPAEYRQNLPHTKGISAVQFILTSNITIHTLELTGKCYVNIFSCKDFNADDAIEFTQKYFKGKIVNKKVFDRV